LTKNKIREKIAYCNCYTAYAFPTRRFAYELSCKPHGEIFLSALLNYAPQNLFAREMNRYSM